MPEDISQKLWDPPCQFLAKCTSSKHKCEVGKCGNIFWRQYPTVCMNIIFHHLYLFKVGVKSLCKSSRDKLFRFVYVLTPWISEVTRIMLRHPRVYQYLKYEPKVKIVMLLKADIIALFTVIIFSYFKPKKLPFWKFLLEKYSKIHKFVGLGFKKS